MPLAIAAALSLSACGGDGADDPQAVAEGASPPAETAAEPNDEPAGEPAPTATEEDSDGLPDGWTLVEADGFSIGLPPGWFDGSRALSDEDYMAELAPEIEGMTDAELADNLRASFDQVDLLAFKTADFNSTHRTNMVVMTQPRGPFADIDPLREIALSDAEKAGATSVKVDEHEVNDLPAFELTYDLPDYDGKGIQTWVLAEDAVVVATYYAAEPDPELWRSMMDTMEPGRGS